MSQDETDERTSRYPTDAAPPPQDEIPTSPHSSEAPLVRAERTAIAPPAKLPDEAELGASALAAPTPPAWWNDSFIGQALGKFADDAEDIRKGRNAQHAQQMAKLDELSADNELIRGELRTFRRAVNETKADTDRQLADLRAEVGRLTKRADELERVTRDHERDATSIREAIDHLEQMLAQRDPAPPAAT